MKYRTLYTIICFIVVFSSSDAAEQWIGVSNKKLSDITASTIIDEKAAIFQFTSSGTFTVDESVVGQQVVFGSSTTNVSPATVQLNSDCILTVKNLGTNTGRPTSNITFQGEGTFAISGSSVTFVESGPNVASGGAGDRQNWYFKQNGVFDLSKKTVSVQNNNFVEMDNALLSSTKINMSGSSSLKITNSQSLATMDGLILSDRSSFELISDNVNITGNSPVTSFADGTTFKFLRSGGEMFAKSSAVNGTITINKVQSSQWAYQVYIEDGAVVESNANTSSVMVNQFIMKAGTLKLNTSNAFYSDSGEALGFAIARANAKIVLGADNDFGYTKVYKSGDNAAGTLFLTLNGNKAFFDEIDITDKDSKFYITDFAEGLLHVESDLAINDDGSLYNIYRVQLDDTGNILSQSLLYQNQNGYITAIAIPEPAEVAMLFGLFAIAFASYRRRR